MGCKFSLSVAVSQVPPGPESCPEEDSYCCGDNNSKPKPLIFAIIRNGHEVIRGKLREIEFLLQRNEFELGIEEWGKLRKWFHMHRQMELGVVQGNGGGGGGGRRRGGDAMGFLRLLDKYCDNISTKGNFYEGYNAVVHAEEELDAVFETADMFQIRGFFYDYKDAVLGLLKREDEIVLACVEDMSKRGLNLQKCMQRHVLGAIVTSPPAHSPWLLDFEFFVRYAATTLQCHHGGMPRVRVYGFALWAVATRKQWEQWNGWIRESCSKESFQELEEAIQHYKK